MKAIILYSVAEYCDHSAKLTIKHQKNQVKTEIWDSSSEEIKVETLDFKTNKKAYEKFLTKIGEAILGGWHILNAFPQRETWETKRSK